MTGTLGWLLLSSSAFVGLHLAIASTPLRGWLVSRLGAGPYRGLYSAQSIALMVWMLYAYGAAPSGPVLWSLGDAGAILSISAMPVAMILLVAGLTGPNPTALGAKPGLEGEEPARGALRITRHPMMWAVGLWAISHAVADGSVRGLIFFGALGVLALLGAHLIDRRVQADRGIAYTVVLDATSFVPFRAIAQGRQSLPVAIREIGLARLAGAVALYAGFLHFHGWMFGVSPYPG